MRIIDVKTKQKYIAQASKKIYHENQHRILIDDGNAEK